MDNPTESKKAGFGDALWSPIAAQALGACEVCELKTPIPVDVPGAPEYFVKGFCIPTPGHEAALVGKPAVWLWSDVTARSFHLSFDEALEQLPSEVYSAVGVAVTEGAFERRGGPVWEFVGMLKEQASHSVSFPEPIVFRFGGFPFADRNGFSGCVSSVRLMRPDEGYGDGRGLWFVTPEGIKYPLHESTEIHSKLPLPSVLPVERMMPHAFSPENVALCLAKARESLNRGEGHDYEFKNGPDAKSSGRDGHKI